MRLRVTVLNLCVPVCVKSLLTSFRPYTAGLKIGIEKWPVKWPPKSRIGRTYWMFVRSSVMNACPQILEVREELQPCYNTLYTLTTMNCSTSCECDCGECPQPVMSQTLESTCIPPPTPLWLVNARRMRTRDNYSTHSVCVCRFLAPWNVCSVFWTWQ